MHRVSCLFIKLPLYLSPLHGLQLKAVPKQHTASFRTKLEQNAPPPHGKAVNDGELACTISHLSALSIFLESGKESVLIFEDDLKQEGKASLPSKFTATMQNVPEDWEFINFGRCWDACENDVEVAPGVVVPTHPMCSHAYSVSRTGAEKIMKACGSPVSLEHTFDACFADLVETKSLISYAPSKALWYQDRNTFLSELGSEGMYRECDRVSEQTESRQRRAGSGGAHHRTSGRAMSTTPGTAVRDTIRGTGGERQENLKELLKDNTLVSRIADFFEMTADAQQAQLAWNFDAEKVDRQRIYDTARFAYEQCIGSDNSAICASGLEGAMSVAEESLAQLDAELAAATSAVIDSIIDETRSSAATVKMFVSALISIAAAAILF